MPVVGLNVTFTVPLLISRRISRFFGNLFMLFRGYFSIERGLAGRLFSSVEITFERTNLFNGEVILILKEF